MIKDWLDFKKKREKGKFLWEINRYKQSDIDNAERHTSSTSITDDLHSTWDWVVEFLS